MSLAGSSVPLRGSFLPIFSLPSSARSPLEGATPYSSTPHPKRKGNEPLPHPPAHALVRALVVVVRRRVIFSPFSSNVPRPPYSNFTDHIPYPTQTTVFSFPQPDSYRSFLDALVFSYLSIVPPYLLFLTPTLADLHIGAWYQGKSLNPLFILVDRRQFEFSRPSGQRQTMAKEYKRPFPNSAPYPPLTRFYHSALDSLDRMRAPPSCRAFGLTPLLHAPRSHREYHPSRLSFLGRGVFLVLWTLVFIA